MWMWYYQLLYRYWERTTGQRILTNGRIAYRAVIEDWIIPFTAFTAAETPNAFQWAGQPQKWSFPWGSRFSTVHMIPRASSETSVDSIGKISYHLNNVNCYQARCWRQYYLPFSNTAHACSISWCAQQFNSCCTKLSTLFLLRYGPQQARAELNWVQGLGSL